MFQTLMTGHHERSHMLQACYFTILSLSGFIAKILDLDFTNSFSIPGVIENFDSFCSNGFTFISIWCFWSRSNFPGHVFTVMTSLVYRWVGSRPLESAKEWKIFSLMNSFLLSITRFNLFESSSKLSTSFKNLLIIIWLVNFPKGPVEGVADGGLGASSETLFVWGA